MIWNFWCLLKTSVTYRLWRLQRRWNMVTIVVRQKCLYNKHIKNKYNPTLIRRSSSQLWDVTDWSVSEYIGKSVSGFIILIFFCSLPSALIRVSKFKFSDFVGILCDASQFRTNFNLLFYKVPLGWSSINQVSIEITWSG